ncbi:cupin domain-containing protein [Nonomuraea cavernae]|uniref:cupin domain-containing protein n=1 Tax=Nonomuraea cavernae TaxID=2045107 RepID=UPI001CD96C7B|nr:cupin domain-containing protein [Nonomuraea cavernae]MCA2183594.1 cupin domain-containing protein [Nonomuraea cavernae]
MDAGGLSRIVQDGTVSAISEVTERPGYVNANLYRTLGPQAAVDGPDTAAEHQGLLPPAGGTVIRAIDFPPESADAEERRRQAAGTFAAIFADVEYQPSSDRHPSMHTTDTVDYAIVLEGEIHAVLDKDETLMRAGDVLIQRGTRHAWSNRSDRMARVVFVLIDGRRGTA